MNMPSYTIVPVTKARSKLGKLADNVSKDKYVVLTKGGSPKAALVDIEYLEALQKDLQKLYQKTFIDPKLLPFSREFNDKEINAWQKEDIL